MAKKSLLKLSRFVLVSIFLDLVYRTRWGSVIAAVRRFLELKETVKLVCKQKNWQFPSDNQIQLLEGAYNVLALFGEVIKDCQAESKVSISQGFGYVKVLIESLDEHQVC